MPIRVQSVDGSPERMILTAMITDAVVLAAVSAKWDGRLFASPWANIVGGWCVDHYKRYGSPPQHTITEHFESWASTANVDHETADLINSLLAYLSEEHSRSQHKHASEFILDSATNYFTKVKIKDTINRSEADLETGKIEQAAKRLADFRKIEMGVAGYDTFASESLIEEMFAVRQAPLITFKQTALANFYARVLERDNLVAFFGRNKIGKSFFLLDMAWRAYTQGCNVAFFVVGDMSRLQVWPRLTERAARRPMEADIHGIEVPESIENIGRDLPIVTFKRRTVKENMTPDDCRELFKRVYGTFGEDSLRVKAWPSGSVSVHGLESELEAWAKDGWRSDVCVIDHADNLGAIDKREDKREQINSTWMAMRAMSQKWHSLVVTASQADTKSFHCRLLTRDNFTDDRRKMDHAATIVGINQTTEEKVANLYRLNCISGRFLKFSETECLWIASCLPIANPMMLATF